MTGLGELLFILLSASLLEEGVTYLPPSSREVSRRYAVTEGVYNGKPLKLLPRRGMGSAWSFRRGKAFGLVRQRGWRPLPAFSLTAWRRFWGVSHAAACDQGRRPWSLQPLKRLAKLLQLFYYVDLFCVHILCAQQITSLFLCINNILQRILCNKLPGRKYRYPRRITHYKFCAYSA